MTAKRATNQHPRVVGKFVRIPEALEPGKVRCPACSAVVTVNKNGTLRKHRMPKGDDCMQRSHGRPVHLAELPPVEMPYQNRHVWSGRAPARRSHTCTCGRRRRFTPDPVRAALVKAWAWHQGRGLTA